MIKESTFHTYLGVENSYLVLRKEIETEVTAIATKLDELRNNRKYGYLGDFRIDKEFIYVTLLYSEGDEGSIIEFPIEFLWTEWEEKEKRDIKEYKERVAREYELRTKNERYKRYMKLKEEFEKDG